jgi:hypothetical protein
MSTDHDLYGLAERVYQAWNEGQVASLLLLDVYLCVPQQVDIQSPEVKNRRKESRMDSELPEGIERRRSS